MKLVCVGEECSKVQKEVSSSKWHTISSHRTHMHLFSFSFSTAVSFSEGLQCYWCSSHISWEHCDQQLSIMVCPDDGQTYVCAKDHEKANGRSKNSTAFLKYCLRTEGCTNIHCLKQGFECDRHCCHNDLCNAATTTKEALGCESIAMFLLTWTIVNIANTFYG